MRLIFLPVSESRSLVYFQKLLAPAVRSKPRWDDRIARKAGRIWTGFERSDKPWKQTLVRWTGRLLDTVPFEENGLKSVPPLNTFKRKLAHENRFISPKQALESNLHGSRLEPVQLVYPASSPACPDFAAAEAKLLAYAESSVGTHKKQMLWCVLGLPLTLPFAINPLMPNFPGMYLAYRLWCNWRAMKGAQHIQHLVKTSSLRGTTLPALNRAYSTHPGFDSGLVSLLNRIFADRPLAAELDQVLRQVKRDAENKAKQAKTKQVTQAK